MSIRIMAKVWDVSKHSGTELLGMLAIANFANDDGCAFPSVAALAKKCRVQPRRMNYILTNLQRSGELQLKVGGGPRGTNNYTITLETQGLHSSAGVHPSAGLHPSAPPPCTGVREPLHWSAPKPSLTIIEPSFSNTRSLLPEISDELFADFQQVRKTKKAAITKTAVDGIRREAAKAGLTIEQVITVCCERGWASFKSEWLVDKPGNARNTPSRHTGFDEPNRYGVPDGKIPA